NFTGLSSPNFDVCLFIINLCPCRSLVWLLLVNVVRITYGFLKVSFILPDLLCLCCSLVWYDRLD
ncbi:unnamed protein product, partial [Brassica napus]